MFIVASSGKADVLIIILPFLAILYRCGPVVATRYTYNAVAVVSTELPGAIIFAGNSIAVVSEVYPSFDSVPLFTEITIVSAQTGAMSNKTNTIKNRRFMLLFLLLVSLMADCLHTSGGLVRLRVWGLLLWWL